MAKSPQKLREDLKNKPKTSESRQRKTKLSTAGIESIRRTVEFMKPYELSKAERNRTYLAMLQDPDVFTPYFANMVMIEKAFTNYDIEYNKESEKSKEIKDFMHYCIEVMFKQTPRSFAGKAATFKMNKLALFEKNWAKGIDEQYKDFWCLSDLSFIDQLTLSTAVPFPTEEHGDKIRCARQMLSAFVDSPEDVIQKTKITKNGYVEIPRNKLTFISDGGSESNPYGTSTFDSIYSEWRYKTLIKDMTLTGVTKDFSGTPVLYIPSWLQEQATSDPDGWEASFLADLQRDMANMHVGDQSYVNLPSDPHENAPSMKEFEIKFLGVEGGGKAFDVVALMEQAKKAIYNAFGAANLLAGDSGGGSYNLIEGQNNIHSHFIKRDVSIIEEAWNKDIWAQTFRLNGFKIDWKDIPKFKAGEIEPVSLDEMGKLWQRLAAVGMAPIKDADFLNEIYEKTGVNYRLKEGLSPDEVSELTSDVTTRSGDGMSEGMPNGTGKSNGSKGDASTGNKENTA